MAAEVEVGIELVCDGLEKGEAGDYRFLFADGDDGMIGGYTCFGHIACTLGRFDLYWIAVRPEWQGKGLGARLLDMTERLIREMGGRRIYIETSSQPRYHPTRAFYGARGYSLAAEVEGFYADGDSKLIYAKILGKDGDRPVVS